MVGSAHHPVYNMTVGTILATSHLTANDTRT